MNSETSNSPFPTSSSMGSSGSSTGSTSVSSVGTAPNMDSEGTVKRMAQKAHEAVDRLEQTLGSSSERMMGLQQEYGDMAREQVRANPMAAIGMAFGVGVIFAKLFMR